MPLLCGPLVSSSKTPNSKILSTNLTYWTMKILQNLLNMSTVQKHRDDWQWQQQLNEKTFCIRLTVSVSVLQGVIKIKRLR